MTKTFSLAALVAALAGCSAGSSTSTSDDGDDPRALRLEFDSFVAPSGKEGLKCQSFANPSGEPIDVVLWTAELDQTGHHMLAFLVDGGEDTPLHDCAGVDNASSLVFQSQTSGISTLEYPAGTAVRIGAEQTLQVQIHWLNTSSDPVEVHNALELQLAAPGTVGRELGELHFDNFDIHVPIGEEMTTTQSCTIDRDIDLVWMTSHMHGRGIGFEARVGDDLVYQTEHWDDPPTGVWSPLVHVNAGDEISFSCSYRNNTDHELEFGPSLEHDEMCVLVGAYLPADGGPAERVTCNSGGSCLSCAEAVMGGDPSMLCTDSQEAFDAFQACTCGTDRCGDSCAATACAGAIPDDECRACTEASCSAELQACFG
jgi:hypothetical protein